MKSVELEILRRLTQRGPAGAGALPAELGITPAAVRRSIRRLGAERLMIGDGERVSAPPFDFLDEGAIRAGLSGSAQQLSVQVVDACPSTNSALLDDADAYTARMLIAEEQTAGRGRRGRRWVSGLGNALTMSIRRETKRPLRELPTLSLVAGVAASRALRGLGARAVHLKWPNDLVVPGDGFDAKLGGILVESRQQGSRVAVVVGIGINLRKIPDVEAKLRRPVAALAQVLDPMPSRNAIAAALASALCASLDAFEQRGFESAHDEWESMNAHAGRRLRVRLAGGRVLAGVVEGVDEHGGLRLRTARGEQAVHSGRVVNARPA